jgi:hypothetical protein
MAATKDVWRLVHTVERLPSQDQEKILRMVDLLTLVPVGAQNCAQQMLRKLLESAPDSHTECLAGVDDVLAYLERNVAATRPTRPVVTTIDFVARRRQRA